MEVVPEGPFARGIELSRGAVSRSLLQLANQFSDLAQVVLIGVSMLLAKADDLIENLRHPRIERGIMGTLADDRATHVVFDDLLDRRLVAAGVTEAFVNGLSDPRLVDQLQQADVVEGGDLSRS